MVKCYVLPKPTFRDWLFGIAPTVIVRAGDVANGDTAIIRLEYKGKELGRIVSKFEPDEITTKEE
jgi:hypothetical protein